MRRTTVLLMLISHGSVRAFNTQQAKQRQCRTRLRAQREDNGFDPRFGWFGLELGFVLADAAKQAVRGKTVVGDLVIAGTDCDALQIRQSQSYVLTGAQIKFRCPRLIVTCTPSTR